MATPTERSKMFILATLPNQNAESVTMIAETREWNAFIKHLQAERNMMLVNLLRSKIDAGSAVTKVSLTRAQHRMVSDAAGIEY
jgi:hypothetical protein